MKTILASLPFLFVLSFIDDKILAFLSSINDKTITFTAKFVERTPTVEKYDKGLDKIAHI